MSFKKSLQQKYYHVPQEMKVEDKFQLEDVSTCYKSARKDEEKLHLHSKFFSKQKWIHGHREPADQWVSRKFASPQISICNQNVICAADSWTKIHRSPTRIL